MERNERQKQLENLIRQHPEWGYSKLNRELKEVTGAGYRKQALLDVKRKVLIRSAPNPQAYERTRKLVLFVDVLPNHIVRQLRRDGFRDFEIAELLARKRKLQDGTVISTTPPPTDGDTLTAMIEARRLLVKAAGQGDVDSAIAGYYDYKGWTKDDSTMDFWKMFRDFHRQNGGSPLIEKAKSATPHQFGKGNIAEQKRRYRERQRAGKESPKPSTKGTPVYDSTGKIAYYQHPVPKKKASWDGQRWN